MRDLAGLYRRWALRHVVAGVACSWAGTGVQLLLVLPVAGFAGTFAGGVCLGQGLSTWRRARETAAVARGLEKMAGEEARP